MGRMPRSRAKSKSRRSRFTRPLPSLTFRWERFSAALFSSDVGLYVLTIILSLVPFGIMIYVFVDQGLNWSLKSIAWRYDLVFTGFVAAAVAFIQHHRFLLTRRASGFWLTIYLLFVLCPAFFCSMDLAFFNNRTTVADYLDRGPNADPDKVESAYRLAATTSPYLTIFAVTVGFVLLFGRRYIETEGDNPSLIVKNLILPLQTEGEAKL